ncbi:hypothetical protein ACHAW6_000310 [Cyclotella cf. meneghiniana]
MEVATTATQKTPINVHFFANNPARSIENFAVLWHLVDIHKTPHKNADNDFPWKGVAEGDLVVFPSLLSGAGEIESVRFVGPKVTSVAQADEAEKEEVLPLLTAGIEYPEFPTLIVSLATERNMSLREMYERPFDAVLKSQPPHYLTLKDLFSQEDELYEQFWQDPPVARRRRPPGGEPWRISLGDCVWIRTLEGRALDEATIMATTEKAGGGEEL